LSDFGFDKRLSFTVSEEVKIARARAFEHFGSDRFSWPGLNGLDKKIDKYLPATGIFLEIGANDGYAQSNTYYLEKLRGWHGILIEPLPRLFQMCRRHRKASTCFNSACVADADVASIEIMDRALESVAIEQSDPGQESVRLGDRGGQLRSVPAARMSSLIDQSPFDAITFMSVDVEGAELSVLGGLD
jgi:FkbM family methyltransferase